MSTRQIVKYMKNISLEFDNDKAANRSFRIISEVTAVKIISDELKDAECRYVYSTPIAALLAARFFVKRFKLRHYQILLTPLKLIDVCQPR